VAQKTALHVAAERFHLTNECRMIHRPSNDGSLKPTTFLAFVSHKRGREEPVMEELNGRMIACQILVTGLIARVANDSKDPLRFLTDFRDEILTVVRGVRIAGQLDTDRVREIAGQTIDELFSLLKPTSEDSN
jgi:hypothetical protein